MTIKRKQFEQGIKLRPSTSATTESGELRNDSADDKLKVYLDSAERSVLTEDQTQTIENKTIDGTAVTGNNTVTTDADQVTYDNLTSGLTATDTQAAIDEVEGRVEAIESATYVNSFNTRTGDVTAQASDYDADQIDYDNTTSGLIATDVQAAIDEVEAQVDALEAADYVNTFNGRSGTVTAQASDYDADQIDFDNVASGLTATDVQAAIDEIVTLVDTKQDDVVTTRGDVIRGSTTGVAERLALGTTGQVLTSDGTDVLWQDPAREANPMTTEGDIIYGGTAGAETRLPVGDEGKVLTVKSGIPSWELSSGLGSLDAFYVETFDETLASAFSTGNNATPLVAGTLNGTLDLDTTTPISGTASLRYTQGAASLNDWFASPAITLERKQSEGGQLCTFKFRLQSTHDQGDIRLFFADGVTNAILDRYDNLDFSQADNKQFAVTLFIPDGTPSLKYGFQVLVANASANVVIDDIEFTQNNIFTTLDTRVDDSEIYVSNFTSFAGSGSNSIFRFSTIEESFGNDITYDAAAGTYTINTPGIYHLNGSTIMSVAGDSIGILRNSTTFTYGPEMLTFAEASNAADQVSVAASKFLEAGDVIRFMQNNNNTPVTGARVRFRISKLGIMAADNVISSLESVSPVKYLRTTAQSIPNSSNVIVDFATKEYDGFGLVTTGSGWQYEVHSQGVHNIHSKVKLEVDNGWSDGETFRLFVSINGTDYLVDFKEVSPSTTSGFEMALQCSVPFFLNRGDTVSIKVRQNSGAAINLDVIDGYNFVAIEKVDKSAIGAFPMASAQGAGLVPYYRELIIDMTGQGDFTGGEIKIVRVGDQVTISRISSVTHSSSSNPNAAGLIPDWARPTGSVGVANMYQFASVVFHTVSVNNTGGLSIDYRDSSDTPQNRTNASSLNISYSR